MCSRIRTTITKWSRWIRPCECLVFFVLEVFVELDVLTHWFIQFSAYSSDQWNTPLTPINARYNYWGFNETYAVGGRIHDHQDDYRLLEVDFQPFHLTNDTLLDVKCPPAWNLVGDTCYMYVGAPMAFHDARDFCSVSYIRSFYEKIPLSSLQIWISW